MAERYQTIYKQGAMYQDDCPLIILASALLRDAATGRMIVQLKMQNVGQKRISAVFVDIRCRNVANEDAGQKTFQYLDLQVKPQEIFGTQIPIELPDDTTRYYSAAVSRVVLGSGQIWENIGDCAANPLVIDAIVSTQYPKELTEQFIRDSGMHTAEICYPQQVSNLKICACGTVYGSELDKCPHCGYTFEQLQHMLDKAVLQKNYEAYTEDVRTKAEQQRIAEEVRRKKTKKTLAITLPVAAVVIAFAILLPRVILPAGDYKKGEALLAAGDFDGAVAAFTESNGYRNASERIPAAYYAKGEALLAAGDYDGAVAAFTEAGSYKDVNERILAVYYAKGEMLLTTEDTFGAAQAFALAGDARKARATWNFDNMLSAGGVYTYGLCADGTVLAVGNNDFGQCDMQDWYDAVAISAGTFHIVGLMADGTAVATGHAFGEHGQCDVQDWRGIVAIAAGFYHTVGLTKDGVVVATEYTGNQEDYRGQCHIPGWRDIIAIAAGGFHTVGLRSDRTVVAVGWDEYSQCNVQEWHDIVAISAGISHTVGLREDGTVVAVGANDSGNCNVQDWRDIVAISAGSGHTVGLKADGTVVAIGENINGQCNVGSWRDIVTISAGSSHTVGLRADGTVIAAGDNDDGQCNVQDWDLW